MWPFPSAHYRGRGDVAVVAPACVPQCGVVRRGRVLRAGAMSTLPVHTEPRVSAVHTKRVRTVLVWAMIRRRLARVVPNAMEMAALVFPNEHVLAGPTRTTSHNCVWPDPGVGTDDGTDVVELVFGRESIWELSRLQDDMCGAVGRDPRCRDGKCARKVHREV